MSYGQNEQLRMGFLTSIEDAERGFVGGLLVTNRFGRPLEFHCTAPVKPNRAQTILYGPTLRPFVLSELIGRTLIDKIGVKPHLVLLEFGEILGLRQHVPIPVGCLVEETAAAGAVCIGKFWIETNLEYPEDRTEIEKFSKSIPAEATLIEPFDRVREALDETLRLGAVRIA